MTIANFAVRGFSPAPEMNLALGERLNILTGDNSLGKTLLLDSLFWSLSGDWVDQPVYPDRNATFTPEINLSASNGTLHTKQYRFNIQQYEWDWHKTETEDEQSLTLYARSDGSFALQDPFRRYSNALPGLRNLQGETLIFKTVAQLSREQVLDGFTYRDEIDGKERTLCNGLIRDWLSWQYRPDQSLFNILMATIATLSPPDTPISGAGTPVRLPNDAREIPTLKLLYGEVPLYLTASGLRRIVSLAYMLVWFWNEHRIAAELTKRPPLRNLIVLVDEIEAHLHPKWQRAILPALLNASQTLSEQLQVQFVVVTHAPLVLTSAEPLWDAERDRLFHLNLHERGELAGKVTLEETPFVVHGDATGWLTSEIFELEEARSLEAEAAIKAATRLQMQAKPVYIEVQRVDTELARLLSPLDPFWPLWRYFAQVHGVHE